MKSRRRVNSDVGQLIGFEMRRIVPIIVGILLTIGIGLSLVLIVVARRPTIDQRAIPRVAGNFSCNELPTTDNFQQFLSDFRAATKTDDKAALYSLTTRCEFHWWDWGPQGIKLRSVGELNDIAAGRLPESPSTTRGPSPLLVFEGETDFFDNYTKIFSAETKEQIIHGTLTHETSGSYDISWPDKDFGMNYLLFRHIDGIGYKFAGSDWEP